MNITETRVFRGPNLYSRYDKVIRLTLDLEEMEHYPSNELENFAARLVEAIPSLQSHRCSEGVLGGFVNRLRRGTWMGHVIEHVAIELQSLAGSEVGFGKTRGTGVPGMYYVIFEYQEEKVGLAAVDLAIRLVRSLFPPDLPSALPVEERQLFNFQKEKEQLLELAADQMLGPSTHSLVRAAEKRNIPWLRLDEQSLIQLGYGIFQKRIQATITAHTSQIATEIASDKHLTNRLLHDSGVPAPVHRCVNSEEEAVEAAEEIGYPVVTKPINLSHGRGASLNLGEAETVREGFRQAREQGGLPVLVEQFLVGNDYRILVIDNQVVAVAQRIPGHVIGDGAHTIRELVEIVNADPRRGFGHEKVLTRLTLDYQARRLLDLAGLTPESVLPNGQICFLRSTGNMSTGGTAVDRTDVINLQNAELALSAARIIGLDVAGIDMITPDISQPVREMGGGIVEVNAAPGFRMHIAPSEGIPRDVAGPVIDMLYPPGARARIPIAAITGTNGKTTTTFMVGHILKMAGKFVGMATTDGIYLDGERYLAGDLTGPWSAHMILKDSRVEAAVLETARGGILREGLGFDECEVGAILNVSADHLGLKGVETVEQMAEVKSLVIEVVSKNGYAVLNGDDPVVSALAPVTPGKPVYFSMSGRNRLVSDHIQAGGRAVGLERGLNGYMITLYDNNQHIPVVYAHEIPATLDAQARFNIANALAATAIAYGLGVPVNDIRLGLQTFSASFQQIPGRMNVYDEHGFRVIVDYAHNPAAMQSMCDLVRATRRPLKIGVIAAPGDRRDVDIAEMGQIAAGAFDELIIKEEADLRGRVSGEVIRLLRQSAIDVGFPPEKITLAWTEPEGVQMALDRAVSGGLVVVFADEVENVWNQVVSWRCPVQNQLVREKKGVDKISRLER
jgi:cyanophycin synthetase